MESVPFLILVNFQSDPEFREFDLLSDLTADGIAIVWLARLLRIPIKERVAGSDIFDLLKLQWSTGYPLRIFFVWW